MTKPPNILLLFTDQQRFDTIGALGNPIIRTPNLDRLVTEGTAFTSAYTPSPVCVSARCSMHTGLYPWKSGCSDNNFDMPRDRPTLQSLLTAAGYRTHGTGKCHFRPDRHALWGFQSRDIQEEATGRDPDDHFCRWLSDQGFLHVEEPHGVRSEMYYLPQVSLLPSAAHPSAWVGDRSCAFLDTAAGGAEPFFLFASFIHPHPPFAPPTPWHKCYRPDLMPLPKVPADHEHLWTFINRYQNRYKGRDAGWDANLVRTIKAHYYACISFVDFQIGRILHTLEERGILDDTLILFASDHGELLGDYRCFGKRSFHDSCSRIPLLARLPGRFAAGGRCAIPASLVDLLPTALAVAGIAGPADLDGVDLAGLAAGGIRRPAVFSQFNRGANGIWTAVDEDWKFVYSASDEREYLLDRRRDLDETRDRAGTPFAKEALAATRRRLVDRLRADGATDDLDGDGFKRYGTLSMPASPDAGHLIQEPPGMFAVPGYGLPR